MIALVNYMNQILVELVKLANLIVQVSKALACAGRVQAVLDTEPGMEFPAASRPRHLRIRPGTLCGSTMSA